VTFVAGTPGLYEITLTVTDPYGAATSITFPVHVSPAEECAQACDCPEGFDVAPAGDGCLRTEIAEPTIYDTTYQVCKAEYNPNYSRDGAQYPGGLIVENSYWGESYADPDSRLNTVGVWACDPDSVDTGETYVTTLPTGEWIGFAVCLDIPEGGDYLIGLGADNRLRFSLNGNLEFAMLGGSPDNFTWWWINPIQLSSGLNIIELEGYNISQAASFGAEIAGPFPAGSLNTDADMAAADYAGNLIFSTLDQIGINFTLGESSGTQCPEGFALNTCSPAQECIRIQRVDCR